MKKIITAFAFFIMGVGTSYFVFNHSISTKKDEFKKQIEEIVIDEKAEISTLEDLQAENAKLNAKIFQLMFTFFGIDVREEVKAKSTEVKVAKSNKIIEKDVERFFQLSKTIETVTVQPPPKKRANNIENLNVSTFLEDAFPIDYSNKLLKKLDKFKKINIRKKNGPKYILALDNQYKISKKEIKGVFKTDYSLLGKSQSSSNISGSPTHIIYNNYYPDFLGIWTSNRSLLIIQLYSSRLKGIYLERNGYNSFSLIGNADTSRF